MHPWNVYDGPAFDASACLSRNFEIVSRWGVFSEAKHAHWARVASFAILAVDRPSGMLPRDVCSRQADAHLALDVYQFWQICGVDLLVPSLDATGRMQIKSSSFALQAPLQSIGRGITLEKPLTQVTRLDGMVGRCIDSCGTCDYCKFALYAVCAREHCYTAQTRVVVQCEALAAGAEQEVLMHFLVRPSVTLVEASYRCFNSFTFLVSGTYRHAQRTAFSAQEAMSSLRATDRDSTLQAFVDLVVSTGWHTKVCERLAQEGIISPPFPHQSSSILAMLEMEGRAESAGFQGAPRFGRQGISGFLRAALVPVTAELSMCSLTGAVLTRDHANQVCESARGGLLALPAGVGKTYTCVALSVLAWTPGKYAAIVFCPKHLVLQWKDEIRRFLPASRVVSSHTANVDLTSGPVFLVASQEPSIHTAIQAAAHALAGAHPAGGEPLTGARAARYIVDEAHGVPVPYPERRPASGEAVWAVTATPFFARTARAAWLFDILQKVPRHFGIPTIHAQLTKMLRREVGLVFKELVLNLHDLDDLLPSVKNSTEVIQIRRADVMQGASWRGAYALLQGAPSQLVVHRANDAITRAASLGLVFHVDELTGHAAARRFTRPAPTPMPDWSAVPGEDSGGSARNIYSEDECVVCLSTMEGFPSVSVPCGHAFHYGCLTAWHAESARECRCPICRTNYSINDVRRCKIGNASVEQPSDPTQTSAEDAQARDEGRWDFSEVHLKAIEQVEAHLARNEGKAIVFLPQAAAARLGPLMRRRGIDFVSCVDAAGSENRANAIHSFVEQSAAKVLLIDPLSFETGLNLTVANFVLSYPYHRGSMEQMAGRVRRLGQRFETRFVQMHVDVSSLLVQQGA